MANTKKNAGNELATKPQAGALALPFDYGQDAGQGWENTDQSDFQIPFLNLLQNNSPQCVEGETGYRADAKPGMFFNSVTERLIDGPVHFVIALTQHVFVEWRSEEKGGGFVGEHDVHSDVVAGALSRAENPLELKTEDGNDLVETYKMYALLLESPEADTFVDQVVISFSKTKIKRYKAAMTRLRTVKGSNRIPLFAHRLTMSPTSEKNPSGKPYKNVAITSAIGGDPLQSLIGPDHEVYAAAQALREAVSTGAARADYNSASAEGKTGGGGSDEAADEVFGD